MMDDGNRDETQHNTKQNKRWRFVEIQFLDVKQKQNTVNTRKRERSKVWTSQKR